MCLSLICSKIILPIGKKHLMIQKSTCIMWVCLCKGQNVKKAAKFQYVHYREEIDCYYILSDSYSRKCLHVEDLPGCFAHCAGHWKLL